MLYFHLSSKDFNTIKPIMRIQLKLAGLLLFICSACTPTLTKIFSDSRPGEAVIQHENGTFSSVLDTKEAFAQLRSNEKLHLSTGRVELLEPLTISGLENIQILGDKTALVAKVDMPVVTFKEVKNVKLRDLLVVHEIGEWCSQNCVEFYSSSDLDIQNCKFDGSGYFGLALTNVNKATIEKNKFFNCEYGLAVWSSSNLFVKGNSFSKNRDKDIMVNDDSPFSNDYKKENTFLKE